MELTARAVQAHETDRMLALMCRAFGMDPVSARCIFYTDPFYDLSMKRVLLDERGELVSCLTLIPSSLYLGRGVSIPVCGVAGVCTNPVVRGRGFAAALINATMPQIAAEFDFTVAALTADKPEYYQSLGWEFCGDSVELTLTAKSLKASDRQGVQARLLTVTELSDVSLAVREVYARRRGGAVPGAFGRDERRWRCIEQSPVRRIAGCFNEDALTGYAAYSIVASDAVVGARNAIVHEIVSSSPEVSQALLACIAEETSVTHIKGVFSLRQASELLSRCECEALSQPAPPVLMRSVNLLQLLDALCSAADMASIEPLKEMSLLIEISPSARMQGEAAALHFSGKRIAVSRHDGTPLSGDSVHLSGTRGAITQLLLGCRSARQLRDQQCLAVTCADANIFDRGLEACNVLFPDREIFLSPPDVF